MSSGAADVAEHATSAEHVTTEARCPVCVMTLPLDDDRPRLGTVRWKIVANMRLNVGIAVWFECPNGHSSADDPTLLKSFHSRRF
jgi:hypothetical protein